MQARWREIGLYTFVESGARWQTKRIVSWCEVATRARSDQRPGVCVCVWCAPRRPATRRCQPAARCVIFAQLLADWQILLALTITYSETTLDESQLLLTLSPITDVERWTTKFICAHLYTRAAPGIFQFMKNFYYRTMMWFLTSLTDYKKKNKWWGKLLYSTNLEISTGSSPNINFKQLVAVKFFDFSIIMYCFQMQYSLKMHPLIGI